LQKLAIGRVGKGDRVPAVLIKPEGASGRCRATLVVHSRGKDAVISTDGKGLHPLAKGLLERGCIVMALDCFGIGESPKREVPADAKYFTTYNRTDAAERVQDILTALAYIKSRPDVGRVCLAGVEDAGLWCLLARALAPQVESCAVDARKFNVEDDEAFLERLWIPLLRRAGDVRTAVALAAPRRLFIHNTGAAFSTEWLSRLYRDLGARENLAVKRDTTPWVDVAEWLCAAR
jgi:hypothetical protein